ncbi:hypothetical protein CUB90_07945 [Clostridium sp. CT7]|nr:hypothetical protein CUB90_07945 [Clostridium sp. CT7]
MPYLLNEVTMLKERFKKILINLGSKVVKHLNFSILSYTRFGLAHYPSLLNMDTLRIIQGLGNLGNTYIALLVIM